MSRFELTIKASYLPNWGMYEAIRELVQNARDAEIEFGAKMTVEHVYRVRNKRPIGALVICNEGTTIDREALLIGHTSKLDRDDLIGQYGEGLKFALLAALRLGLEVKIRNGSETWTPVIVRSEKFKADVLAIDVSTGHKNDNRVQIELLGIEVNIWDQLKEKFLFLNPPVDQSVVRVPGGEILLAANQKGCVFVKGLYVCQDNSLFFGYNAYNADIDRDRRMVSDLRYLTGNLLTGALKAGKLTEKIYELLHENSNEVYNVDSYYIGEMERDALAALFKQQYGEDAVPVETDSQTVELGHFGKRGIKVPYNLRTILQAKLGTAEQALDKFRSGVSHFFDVSSLEMFEQDNFNCAMLHLRQALLGASMDQSVVDHISIVTFGDSKLLGTFTMNDSSIRISRNVLCSASKCLRVLIHEVAHMSGKDGTTQHEAAIGLLTEKVFDRLLSK